MFGSTEEVICQVFLEKGSLVIQLDWISLKPQQFIKNISGGNSGVQVTDCMLMT